jgi:hypothetical protein
MLGFWRRHRRTRPEWVSRTILFGAALVLCATILVITVYEKFAQGGWITVVITILVIALCFAIRRHYRRVTRELDQLYHELGELPRVPKPRSTPLRTLDPRGPTAAVLVGCYGGVGIHTVLNILRVFPGHFKNLVFLSVGVIDSGEFKGENAIEDLRRRTREMQENYLCLADSLGVPAAARMTVGTEAVEGAEKLCLEVSREFPHLVFFAGKMIFQREAWYHRLLHNETALAVERRLRWMGKTMVTLPVRVQATPLR